MENKAYIRGFLPYEAAAFLVGIVGGFSALLGPAFVQELGIPYNNATWTALATSVSGAAFAPVLGKLGDILGRRRTLLLGTALFTLGNALTAAAPNLLFMLLARIVVGTGMAAVAPVVMAYILTEFPPHAIAKGFSVYMLISSGAVVFGPTLGSLMIDVWGWRTMIWLCTALGAATLVFCFLFREKNSPGRKTLAGFDGAGAALVVAFFSLALCVPSFGQNLGWTSGAFLAALVGAMISLGGLILVERKAENPILPGSFLFRRAFVLSVLALFLTQGLMQANMTNTIVFVNYTQPDNTVVSGYAISVMYLGMALGSILLGPLADRFEPKKILTGSFGITGAGTALLLLFGRQTSALLMMAALGILGFGLGANGTIFMKVVLSGLSPETAGAGTGTYGLFRDLAAPFGVAILVPLFTNRIDADIAAGMEAAAAAVESIRHLGIVELVSVGVGILLVQLLPTISGQRKEENK